MGLKQHPNGFERLDLCKNVKENLKIGFVGHRLTATLIRP